MINIIFCRRKRKTRTQFESKKRSRISYKETSSNDATPAASSDEEGESDDEEEDYEKPRPKRFKKSRSDEEDEKVYEKPGPKRFKKSRSSDESNPASSLVDLQGSKLQGAPGRGLFPCRSGFRQLVGTNIKPPISLHEQRPNRSCGQNTLSAALWADIHTT